MGGGLEEISDRELLASPIHAVEGNWGIAGLRRLLAAVLDGFDETGQAAVLRAERIASWLHADDRRSGDRPYLGHLLRVTIRIGYHYHVRDADVLCAALLHDSVEDHAGKLADFATDDERGKGTGEAGYAVLGRAFSPRMAGLVRAVTTPETEPALPLAERQELYRGHVAESLEREPWARVIKLSDFTDNGVGIMWTVTETKRHVLASKYAPLVPQMIDFATRDDTPLDPEVKRHIVEQLETAKERFAAILGSGS